MKIEPSGQILGASILGVDLSQPLRDVEFGGILHALGEYGVVCFHNQSLTPQQQIDFSRKFGELEIHVSGAFQEKEHPEIMILSNIVEDGRPIGLADAGQDWHTDMSFSRVIAFTNVLYALKVPHRNGRPLGNTEFASMAAAYDALSPDVKRRIDKRTATHNFEKFWEMMRQRGGKATLRPPLTDEQRRVKPPVSHPMVLIHPISGRKILYANPGYTVSIDGMGRSEGDALLDELFQHQLNPAFRYSHIWSEGDVLVWDNLQTLHNARADYGPDEHRLIKRCQAMANLVFEPRFKQLAEARVAV
jgi:taurine dioxygenase